MFIKHLFYQQEGSSYIQIILASTAIAGLALVGLKLASEQKSWPKIYTENIWSITFIKKFRIS